MPVHIEVLASNCVASIVIWIFLLVCLVFLLHLHDEFPLELYKLGDILLEFPNEEGIDGVDFFDELRYKYLQLVNRVLLHAHLGLPRILH